MCKRLANTLRLLIAAAALALGSVVVVSQSITIPNTFVNGTVADATQVNANFSALSANALNRAAGILSGTATPSADNTIDLGSSGLRFANVYGVQFRGGGANLTALTAGNLTGTVPQAQLGAALLFGVVGGRCSAQTANPVPVADVTAATSIYFTPYGPFAGVIGLYDGSTAWNIRAFSELSLGLGADAANTNYDLFVFDNSGTPTLERLAWTNDTTRATAIVLQNNYYVKAGATTRRYVCSYRTTTAAGQTEDSLGKRFVSNYYSRDRRPLRRAESNATWNYTLATWHQANAGGSGTANQVEILVGVAEPTLSLTVQALVFNATGTPNVQVSIGEDSTTVQIPSVVGGATTVATSTYTPVIATLAAYKPPLGKHTYVWQEISSASGTTAWQGQQVIIVNTLSHSALSGWMEN